MPETDKPKVTKFATRKIGPLPVWAWGLTAIAFVALVWYLRSRGEQEVTTTTDSDYGQEPIGPPAPEPGGGGVIDIPWPENPPTPGPIPFPDWPYPSDPNPPSGPIYETPSDPTQTQPPPDSGPSQPPPETTPAPKPQRQTSFQYFGRTWRKGDLVAFRKKLKSLPKSSIYSGPNGYAVWAKNHPKVIEDFPWPKS